MAPRTLPADIAATPSADDLRLQSAVSDLAKEREAEAGETSATVAAKPSVEALLAQFGVKVPATPAPIVGVLYAVPEDPFRPVGDGVDTERYEYARGVISPDPTVGDLSIREMEKKGFKRLPAGFPARLAGVQGSSDVMLIRSKERAAFEHAKEATERRNRKMGPKATSKQLMDGVKSHMHVNRRSVPRELAGV